MSDVFFEEMKIPRPEYNLGIGGLSHGIMTGRMIEKIEEIYLKEKPDIVLVYGDTNSTLAGSLAAVKLNIPVAHVEAGLRSFNNLMPEEINRILTDRISKWLFCPTENAVKNLKKEGVAYWSGANVYNVGDVMYDAALYYKSIAVPTDFIKVLLKEYKNGFYLATIHRAENTDNLKRLNNIIKALEFITHKTPVVLPLHPRTKEVLHKLGLEVNKVKIIDPIGYFDMITLLSGCKGVFTDSGGLQKEAFYFKKPCITLRNETEWTELVDRGFNVLAGANYEKIIELERSFMHENKNYDIEL